MTLSNSNGSALIFVISLAIILNIAFMTVYFTVSSTQKNAGGKRVNTTALAIAEAGKEHALSLLRSGSITPVANSTIYPLTNISFSNGTYSIKCRANAAADSLFLQSSAQYVSSRCSIEVVFAVTSCPVPTDSAYNYGIIANNTITWSGSGTCNTGTSRLHTNNQFSMTGSSNFICQLLSSSVQIAMSGSGDINGSIKAPSLSKSGSGKITGTTSLVAVSNVAIPNIDLTPYHDYAVTNGQVFSGKTITGSASVVIPGGVMWVDGDFKYSGSGNVSGSIIATGNIDISGSGDFTAASTYPALVSRDGTISMSGSGRVTGLIYTRVGSITKSGSGDVNGSIICGGNFSKSGSWSTLTYINSAPVPPNCSGKKYKEVAWRELQ